MKAGSLKKRVEIKKYGTELDEYGDPVPGWQSVATLWADVRMLSGLETVRSGIEVSEVTASIRIRYMEGLDASMVVVIDGASYEIEAVMPDLNNKIFIDLLCKVRA